MMNYDCATPDDLYKEIQSLKATIEELEATVANPVIDLSIAERRMICRLLERRQETLGSLMCALPDESLNNEDRELHALRKKLGDYDGSLDE